MKSIIKIWTLALLLTMISCGKNGKDEDDQNNITTGIVGQWDLSSMELRNGNITMSGQSVGSISGTAEDYKGGMDLKSDGSMVSDMSYTMTTTTSLSIPGFPPQTFTDTRSIPQNSISGSYELINEDKLRLTANDTTIEYNVVSYSAERMELEYSFSQSQDIMGMEMKMVADQYMAFDRR